MTVTLKDQLLLVLDHSDKAERSFIAGLSAEQRSAEGTYEHWCAKDIVAHVAYWEQHQATRLAALAQGVEPPPSPGHFETVNAACFERYCHSSWEEVQADAHRAQTELLAALRALDEHKLCEPLGSEGRALWQDVVNTASTHLLMHLAEFYAQHGRPQDAGQLWQEWSQLVAPLDTKPEWCGLVHYNAACGLALSGNPKQAIAELRQALELRPSLTSWSRQDTDLAVLHDLPEYKKLYAPEYWWAAIEAGPQAEALADQFLRALAMLRQAIQAFPAEEWRKGDTPYQRPAGWALHVLTSTDDYCALKPGQAGAHPRFDVYWEEKDSSKLPSQDELLAYLDQVERKLAGLLAQADLSQAETLFRWTGATLLSRLIYALRHTQHHLAEMCLELHRRGIPAPQWQ